MFNNQTNDRYVPNTLDNTNAPKIISALCANEEIAVKFGKKFEGALPNKVEKKGNNLLLTITVRNRRIKLLIDYNGNIIESPDDGFKNICSDSTKDPNANEPSKDDGLTVKDNDFATIGDSLTTKGGGLELSNQNFKSGDFVLPSEKCCALKSPEKVLGPGPKHFANRLCRFGTIQLYVKDMPDSDNETCIKSFTPVSIERTFDNDGSLTVKHADGETLIYDPETRQGTLLPA